MAGAVVEPAQGVTPADIFERGGRGVDILALGVADVETLDDRARAHAVGGIGPRVVVGDQLGSTVGDAIGAAHRGVGSEALLADPREPPRKLCGRKLVGEIGGLSVGDFVAVGGNRPECLEIRALKIRVGRAVEELLVDVDVEDGVGVIDEVGGFAPEFLAKPAGPGGEGVRERSQDHVLALHHKGLGVILAVIRRDKIDLRPVVDGLVGHGGLEEEGEEIGLVTHEERGGLEVADVAVLGQRRRGSGCNGITDAAD